MSLVLLVYWSSVCMDPVNDAAIEFILIKLYKIYVPVSGVGGIWVGLMNKHYWVLNNMICTVCILTPYNKLLPIVLNLIPNEIHSNTLMWVGIIYIQCVHGMDIW